MVEISFRFTSKNPSPKQLGPSASTGYRSLKPEYKQPEAIEQRIHHAPGNILMQRSRQHAWVEPRPECLEVVERDCSCRAPIGVMGRHRA